MLVCRLFLVALYTFFKNMEWLEILFVVIMFILRFLYTAVKYQCEIIFGMLQLAQTYLLL